MTYEPVAEPLCTSSPGGYAPGGSGFAAVKLKKKSVIVETSDNRVALVLALTRQGALLYDGPETVTLSAAQLAILERAGREAEAKGAPFIERSWPTRAPAVGAGAGG